MLEILIINFAKGASRTGKNFGKVCTSKSDVLGLLREGGRYRRETEGCVEVKSKK